MNHIYENDCICISRVGYSLSLLVNGFLSHIIHVSNHVNANKIFSFISLNIYEMNDDDEMNVRNEFAENEEMRWQRPRTNSPSLNLF